MCTEFLLCSIRNTRDIVEFALEVIRKLFNHHNILPLVGYEINHHDRCAC